jgi:hypothetical protein
MKTSKTSRSSVKTSKTVRELPPNVNPSDTVYPRRTSYDDSYWTFQKTLREIGLETSTLTFYKTTGIGWVLTTLHISNPSRRQSSSTPPRTYGIGVADSKVYTVGRGPHVTEEVTIYLTPENYDRLKVYVQLWTKGMADASQIRDRISSRRAQGQLHRSNGRTSWMW